jgi:hypothetical protein
MYYVLLISILNMRFTGKITLKAHQNMKQKICSVGGRQGITLPDGNKVYTLIRMQCCDPVCIFLFGMPIFCKPVG